ncbi:MAG: hypothetical protein M3680_10425 [Myxococcota bacterium]|nr:hypothetical protein [Myxococcota bacterium]
MRPAWLVLALCAAHAGCDDGILIEVRAPAGSQITEVELFLGLEKCGADCPGIKPEVGTELLPGEVYFRDDPEVTRSFTAKVVDGVATFELVPSDAGDRLHVIAAIGNPSAPTAAALVEDIDLRSGPRRYIVQLAAANDGFPATPPNDGTFVALWQQERAPQARCIGVERWRGGELADRAFIVPREDPDCDDHVIGAGECNPLAHDDASMPEHSELACVTLGSSSSTAPSCRLGGPACIDGAGPDGMTACAASDICVPSAVCAEPACATATTQAALRECLGAAAGAAIEIVPRIECTAQVRKAADGTGFELCHNAIFFDIDPQIGQECVSAADAPLLLAPTGAFAFVPLLSFVTSDPAGGAPLTLDVKARRETACKFRFDLSGQRALTAVDVGETTVLRVSVAPPGGAPKHLLFPLVLRFPDSDCTEPPTCVVVGPTTGDLFTCAQ